MPGEISRVSFYINKTILLEVQTASPADGTYGVSFQGRRRRIYRLCHCGNRSGKHYFRYGTFCVGTTGTGIMNPGRTIGESLVYPNPSGSGFYFRLTPGPSSRVTIRIFNVYGQLIEKMVTDLHAGTAGDLFWSAEGRDAGVYLYRISAGTRKKTD